MIKKILKKSVRFNIENFPQMYTLIPIFTHSFLKMTLVRKKTKETYFQDRVITKAPSTREGIKHSLNNFERFCSKQLQKVMKIPL